MIKILTDYVPEPRRKHVVYFNGAKSCFYQEIRWFRHVEFSDGRTRFYNHYYQCTFEEKYKKISKIKNVWNWFVSKVLELK